VERLDWEGRKAFVTRTRADYYTDAIDYTRLKILECFEGIRGQTPFSCSSGKRGLSPFRENGVCPPSVSHGEVHLVRRIAGYKKIRYYTHENIGYGHIDLPDQQMHTTAVWWQLAPAALDAAFASRQQALDGFLGAGYALHIVAAMRMLSEPRDIGRAVGDGNAEWFATVGAAGRGTLLNGEGEAVDPAQLARFTPTLFLYDNYPGGIGLSAPLFEARDRIVADARGLVGTCECAHGCPACIGPILAGDEVRGYSPRVVALRVLELLSDRA
jgi:DEAD/DEAH box helicase domain-containing protein